ncbi:UDP-N-acetylmuramoyl-L-alanyl-D-glutamate synthetase [Lysobacter concretionis Ko07 = DSM 16239]|uniref:UDP-N-acetylmuramoyl-L-alanine--L-glutamate ligase n=1 Tax=Lysobacter concretionis Ko07 = DSM 16239 TaxID=1122185 RepID=A0A0A0ELK6_9GAMM|nr:MULTISPECIES: UDP-N-acetylmuramoyl-L-alanine--D-glutamate ligase [Lysobacter]KGM51028.1 UDP-N-acetylmuramoyl-L-alanyl-D-glutamate synthetase [Lysobacter concretionis Ko07 = DSM 16239]QOD92497.1 UDP-N-acetylmuramoyl-L-alanine--D-glutamate ligase [Lysobacter sp. CW239]
MLIAQLDGRKVALWGWGREGHAAYRAIRTSLPGLPLTLFCLADEVADARALGDPRLVIEVDASAAHLSAFDIVVKSPGISPYRAEAVSAAAQGTRFIGGTALWFGGHAGQDGIAARTVCVTGTKGKSTTTALLAHLLRAGGHRTALAGNIGLPLLELDAPPADQSVAPEVWAIELSSYQTGDVAASGVRPEVAVVLNVFPEHLDWHGSEARYVEDKLRLITEARPVVAVLNAADPRLAALSLPDSQVRWFGNDAGWHLRGDVLYRGETRVMDTAALPLPGRHNRGNLCAVLTVIEALGFDAAALAPHAATFRPLPHRLQTLGARDGLTWVNDSISTTPHASLAALDCFRDRRVAILVGGHDRGIDWADFAAAMQHRAPAAIVTMGANGPRIHQLLEPLAGAGGFTLMAAADLADAVVQARTALGGDGVILLSPGAPSFGPYRDYVARGRHFAQLGGFDPDSISAIPGLGVA